MLIGAHPSNHGWTSIEVRSHDEQHVIVSTSSTHGGTIGLAVLGSHDEAREYAEAFVLAGGGLLAQHDAGLTNTYAPRLDQLREYTAPEAQPRAEGPVPAAIAKELFGADLERYLHVLNPARVSR
jgi:hypothetical protein